MALSSRSCAVREVGTEHRKTSVLRQAVNVVPNQRTCRPLASASASPLSNAKVALAARARAGSRCARLVVKATTDGRPWKPKDCRLVLSDGTEFLGSSFGARGTEIGEVVFNTSLSGYQEIMTDPSYKGQFVAFTCPHIGNVGINMDDMESTKCHLGAVIVRDYSVVVSNYRSKMNLDQYCKEQGVMGISNIDTRALTKILRETGCLVGVITTDSSISSLELATMARGWTINGKDLLSVVSCTEPYEWKDPTIAEWEFSAKAKAEKEHFHVVAYDFGIKHNILRRLASFGCRITVVPATFPASEVLKMNPDGIFLSNGPGDPSAAPYAVENAKEVLGKKPLFGICMGHQILGQALGGKTFKLKFGHHGGNHPIKPPSGVIEISAQNHNFAVDPATLPKNVVVTHINLNDGTCAGMMCADKQAISIQYHPEASPGPHDSDVCFEQFIEMMRSSKKAKVPVAA